MAEHTVAETLTHERARDRRYVATIGLTSALQANAALFDSTKVEALYGDYEGRGDEKQGILTIANASGFKYGRPNER